MDPVVNQTPEPEPEKPDDGPIPQYTSNSPLNAPFFAEKPEGEIPLGDPLPSEEYSGDSTPEAPLKENSTETAQEPDKGSMQEPHPTTGVGKVAKATVEAIALTHHRPSDWSLIVQSAVAGTVSVCVTLPVCQIAAQLSQTLAEPGWNAALGVLASTLTYVPTFIGISLYRSRDQIRACDLSHRASLVKDKIVHGLKFLGLQEACEYAARYTLHMGLMFAGMPAWSAFMISAGVTGFLGRLATPWFSRIFKRQHE